MRIETFMLLALIVMIVWSIRLHRKGRDQKTDPSKGSTQALPDAEDPNDMSVDDMVLMDELDQDN